jgi:hypothetical protein
MSTTETTETAPAPAAVTSISLTVRQVPSQIRAALDRLLQGARERVRTGLNLPSHAEIEALIARVEALDLKLAALSESSEAKPKKKNGR